MKKINKAQTILNAFTEELPVNEKWYIERNEICNGCEYNSANTKGKGVVEMLRKPLDFVMGGKPHCNACGCFIEEKTSRKEEECGLASINLEPKWKRLAVITASDTDLNVYNNSPKVVDVDLSKDGTRYEVMYGDVTYASPTFFELVLDGNVNVESVNVGCGCTTVTFKKLSDTLTRIRASVNLKQVAKGKFTKNIYVRYKVDETVKTVAIAVIGNLK